MRKRSRSRAKSGWALYISIALAIGLGWEIVKAPVAVRALPSVALRAAPNSATALQRAAEVELAAGRLENAGTLADESLRRSPFNARALRVRGLVAARQDQTVQANEMLTLAGNWSLRDDPTHAWLIEHRLKQGDYGSAFAHADTLVRRQLELYPSVFNLFSTAILTDRSALPPLTRTLANDPPWRTAYIAYLLKREDGVEPLLLLGAALERSRAPLDHEELWRIYQTWNGEGRLAAVRFMQEQTNRPRADSLLQDGDFSRPEREKLPPLDWQFGSGPGLIVEVSEPDDNTDDLALNVDYDGFGSVTPAFQLLFLDEGSYRLTGRQMRHVGRADALLWEIACVENGRVLARQSPSDTAGQWTNFTLTAVVPAENCTVQRLQLKPRPGERRETTIVSYDKLAIQKR